VGGWAGAHSVLNQPGDLQIFSSGFDLASTTPSGTLDVAHGHPVLGAISGILGNEYTIWAALLGSVFTTMATHGTDQDMVQRMLTAKDHHKARLALVLSGLVDIPVAMGFLFIGILIYVFYQLHPDPNLPTKNPEIFSYYILHQLPTGARGLLIAGVLATAMGSLSTALNALATSFTEDFWVPYWGRGADQQHIVRAVRWSTAVFALLLAAIGTITAAVVVYSPHARIIPVVLGIFGYTYGSLLGIFLLGLTTKDRGTERGNLIAMVCGFIAVSIWSGLPWDLMTVVRGVNCPPPVWLVQIEFPWRVMFGTLTTFAVAWCFKAERKI
jgi:SSS family solute:Na+ symporter